MEKNYPLKMYSLFVIINENTLITSSSIEYDRVHVGHTPLQASVLQKQIVVLYPSRLITSQFPEYSSVP